MVPLSPRRSRARHEPSPADRKPVRSHTRLDRPRSACGGVAVRGSRSHKCSVREVLAIQFLAAREIDQ